MQPKPSTESGTHTGVEHSTCQGWPSKVPGVHFHVDKQIVKTPRGSTGAMPGINDQPLAPHHCVSG